MTCVRLRLNYGFIAPLVTPDSQGFAQMLDTLMVIFASIGAALILFALTYVTLLVGGIVNAMVVLMAGPIVDRFIKDSAPVGSQNP